MKKFLIWTLAVVLTGVAVVFGFSNRNLWGDL
jgi:hypothetical protein